MQTEKVNLFNRIRHSKRFKQWALASIILISTAFFLGGWIESRITAYYYEHDALLTAILYHAAPERVDEAVALLNTSEINSEYIQEGKNLLQERGYTGRSDIVAVRAIFTGFIIFVMLIRGARLIGNMRSIFKRFKKASAICKNPPASEKIEVRQAIEGISERLKIPVDSAAALTEAVLSQKIDAKKYENFLVKSEDLMHRLDLLIHSLVSEINQQDDDKMTGHHS